MFVTLIDYKSTPYLTEKASLTWQPVILMPCEAYSFCSSS
ncbi:hypothetical protein HMPREF9134_00636 [Porphyromonas catoniae F0037]|uniref:Uncharacterized protein n=1 Tax=Porphyromonas catoniae F0037 TaxID=1127696 RepID=L1NGA8_9PORP|nr:hypothetical protein HMPREF9134_00636 [Porphyromonas catoniae F0037]